jgi:hypothetical protein
MNHNFKKLIVFFTILPSITFGITKIFLDTDFKTGYVDYYNLDFELTSSSKSIDSYTFVYSWLDIILKTNIESIDNLEVVTKLTSLGRWGSGNNYKLENSSLVFVTQNFWWEKSSPYPNTDFNPFLSEVYAKYTFFMNNPIQRLTSYFEEIPFVLTLGRQELEFVDGVVLVKNGIGLDAIKFNFSLEKYFYLETFVSRILNEIVSVNNRNYFLYGTVYGTKYQDDYDFGISNVVEKNEFVNDQKIFTEYFIKHKKKGVYYTFEYATQSGKKSSNNTEYSGSLYYFQAGLEGEGKVLGKSNVDIVWLLTTGGDEGKIFAPTFGKFYNGLEPKGWGDFAAGSVKNLFFDLPGGYSGMFVLGMILKVNPIKNFFPGFNYFLYSSPEGSSDKPDASSTEKTLGAKKALGIEYGITSEYVVSDYIKLNFEWLVFEPSKNAFNEKGDPAYKLKFASSVNF